MHPRDEYTWWMRGWMGESIKSAIARIEHGDTEGALSTLRRANKYNECQTHAELKALNLVDY